MNTTNLESIGWNSHWNRKYLETCKTNVQGKDCIPARITGRHHDLFTVQSEDREFLCNPAGRLRQGRTWPAVGDWVILQLPDDNSNGVIHTVLERRSSFQRSASGKRSSLQIIAANIDLVLIISGMDGDFNLRRIERYMTLAWDSGASPVLILNKEDLVEHPDDYVHEAELYTPGAPIFHISAKNGSGVDALRSHFTQGQTAVLVGSSGSGKSTLLNALLGEDVQKTSSLRENDHRGRHTTTSRQLFPLADFGAIIDTPGLREVGLSVDSSSMDTSFSDISELAGYCRFKDCSHEHEPGCAVLEAVREERILPDRYEAYLKQKKELFFMQNRQEALRRKHEWEKEIAQYVKKQRKKAGKGRDAENGS
ncbi:ribosome small subunit-dependent GTPase A [Salinispira pacifica]|uniref:Small ribosomal subunit biogenesis GTPase RsgA n=1 Tax=Salinispira pacifica TaxID=1307761 RepID=V5WJL8_9SPIO|nr:ribosome small subunit-dependent GTPase A [Salinispira pacifica]AHC15361.1 EngC-like putative GTPase [Salinispira pacifica]